MGWSSKTIPLHTISFAIYKLHICVMNSTLNNRLSFGASSGQAHWGQTVALSCFRNQVGTGEVQGQNIRCGVVRQN